MLTDKEMQEIAENFITKLGKENGMELVLSEELEGKDYGNVYAFESKEYIMTGDPNKALGNGFPFMVEKDKKRVVTFGTLLIDNYLIAYENGTLPEASDRYWYPNEDKYSSE